MADNNIDQIKDKEESAAIQIVQVDKKPEQKKLLDIVKDKLFFWKKKVGINPNEVIEEISEIDFDKKYLNERNIHKLLKDAPDVYVMINTVNFSGTAIPMISGLCSDRQSLLIMGQAGLNSDEITRIKSVYGKYASKGLISYSDIHDFVALQQIDHSLSARVSFGSDDGEIKQQIESTTKYIGKKYRDALANGCMREFFMNNKSNPVFSEEFARYKHIIEEDTQSNDKLVDLAKDVYIKIMNMPPEETTFRNQETGKPQKWGEALLRFDNLNNLINRNANYRQIATEVDFTNTLFHNSSLVSEDISDHRDGDKDMLIFTESFFNDDNLELITSQCSKDVYDLFKRTVFDGPKRSLGMKKNVREVVENNPDAYVDNLVKTTGTILASEDIAQSFFIESLLGEIIENRGIDIANKYIDGLSKSEEVAKFYQNGNATEDNWKFDFLISKCREKIKKYEKLEKYKNLKQN